MSFLKTLQEEVITELERQHAQQSIDVADPTTVADLVKNLRQMFPSASETNVLEFVIPRLMSPRFGITLAVVGECELKCSKCHLVPLQFAQLDCGHKFCSSCIVENVGLIDGKFVCPVCGKKSTNIGYHKSDLMKIRNITNIHCPHCSEVFPSIQDFVVHEKQNPDYF